MELEDPPRSDVYKGCYGAATRYESVSSLGFEPPTGLHAGHPLGRSLLVRLDILASHSFSHVLHLHGTFSRDPGVQFSIRFVG